MMPTELPTSWTAFVGAERIASGAPQGVAVAAKTRLDALEPRPVLIFDDATADVVEIDLRGTADDVLRRLPVDRPHTQASDPAAGDGARSRGPGRPKLGVVGREVTLLPRHWDWLAGQPGGASVALRRLVEQARRAGAASDRVRHAQLAAFKFMSVVAGNEPGYEEAIRALFACDVARFDAHSASWAPDVRDYARRLAGEAFTADADAVTRAVVPRASEAVGRAVAGGGGGTSTALRSAD
jgi:uncharacterized protein